MPKKTTYSLVQIFIANITLPCFKNINHSRQKKNWQNQINHAQIK